MKMYHGFKEKPIDLEDPANPIVYLDIRKEHELVGRIIIELYKHATPSTAENFRALCTGELGTNEDNVLLHYKGTKFHKLISYFMIQGGDIVNFNGSGGYSIYGPQFELENFIIPHDKPGILSMVNISEAYCNSQFIITHTECPHLNGRSVAFGRVVKGFSCVKELCEVKTNNDVPAIELTIEDCGEIKEGDPWNYGDIDETDDKLPHGPEDLEILTEAVKVNDIVDTITVISAAGKTLFQKRKFVEADRKYRKCLRYIAWIENAIPLLTFPPEDIEHLRDVLSQKRHNCHLNLSATSLTLAQPKQCVHYCDMVLSQDETCIKAWFRKGKALLSLKDYEGALTAQKHACILSPTETCIAKEIRDIQKQKADYLVKEKQAYTKMFSCNK